MFNRIMLIHFFSFILLVSIGCYGQECGKKHDTFPHLYIVGGHDAQLGEFPWQVSLQYSNDNGYNHFCGGTIIDEYWVLTAAHCFTPDHYKSLSNASLRNGEFQVVGGIIDLTQSGETEQRITASEYILHEDFNESTGRNDVALVKLASAFTFGQYVEPVCLPESTQETTGTATITGWGAVQEGGEFSTALQEIDLPVISDDDCDRTYPGKIIDSMICAGDASATGYSGPCQGDSGGPMISFDSESDSYYISGIVSWGGGCSDPHPSVLMEVSYFINWINDHKTET